MSSNEEMLKLLCGSLKLQKPWQIASLEIAGPELVVKIIAERSNSYPCPKCQRVCLCYDSEANMRSWRHLPILAHNCVIKCQRPRIRCPEHKVLLATAPWNSEQHSHYTDAYAANIRELATQMSIAHLAKLENLTRSVIQRLILCSPPTL